MKSVYLNYKKTNGKENLDETTTLVVPIKSDNSGCGLIELDGKVVASDPKKKNADLYLCCDVCEDSNVGNIKMPVLRRLKRNPNGVVVNSIEHVIWLNINRPVVNSVRIYIADSTGELVSLSTYRLSCLLLFIPNREKQ